MNGRRLSGSPYVGRFAPSPTGPLHAGSLVAALASWLDARAHDGRWLLRIEDVDTPRCVPGTDRLIIDQLAACGLQPDEPPVWQSARGDLYQAALGRLVAIGWAYPCACTRRDIELALAAQGLSKPRGGELVYPGTCRNGLHGRAPRAMRMRSSLGRVEDEAEIVWHDRRLGEQRQRLADAVGDFVLRRADRLWAYQLAVVVDDAHQQVSDVVRGADLRDSTARQVYLQQLLGLPTPRYLHVPVVVNAHGDKLSKQTGAAPIDGGRGVEALNAALAFLGLGEIGADTPASFWPEAIARWARSPWMDGRRDSAAPAGP